MVFWMCALAISALICQLAVVREILPLLPQLVDKFGRLRLNRVSSVMQVVPLAVLLLLSLLILAVWQSDLLMRFTHMIWVLGLWFLGTFSFFSFLIPMRVKLIRLYPALISVVLSIPMAIYCTPIQSFEALFSRQLLFLPGIIGVIITVIGMGLDQPIVGLDGILKRGEVPCANLALLNAPITATMIY